MNRSRYEVINAIKYGLIKDMPITTRDIENDLRENGPLERELKGKTKSKITKAPTAFKWEDQLRDNEVALFGDLIFYKRACMFYTKDVPYGYEVMIPLPRVGKKKTETLVDATRRVIGVYNGYRTKVPLMIFDTEGGMEAAEAEIGLMGCHLELKASGTHTKLIEIAWQHTQARFRGVEATLPYRNTRLAQERGLMWTVRENNQFQTKTGIPGMSAYETLVGRKPEASLLFRGIYGRIYEVTVYRQMMASSEPRTITGKMIGWTGNLEGAMEFENLATGKKVTSASFKLINTTRTHIDRCNELADKEAKGLKIDPMGEEGDDDLDDDEEQDELEEDDVDIFVPDVDNRHGAEAIARAELNARSPARDDAPVLPERDRDMLDGIRLNLSDLDIMQEGNDVDAEIEGPAVNVTKTNAATTVRDLFKMYIGKKNDMNRYLRNYHIQFRRALEKYGSTGVDVALKEIRQLHDFRTFKGTRAVDLSPEQRRRIIRSSMFFKEKFFADGKFDKLKARLVAGGHMQDKSLYDDRSSPTVNLAAVFMLAALAARNKEHVMTVDVTGAYLNAEVKEEVHMRLDKNLAALLITVDKSYEEYLEKDGTMLVKLNRALYGLVESAKLWYEHLKGTLERHGRIRQMCIHEDARERRDSEVSATCRRHVSD
jgi:hypothetical protein